MKPLIVLITIFLLSLIVTRLFKQSLDYAAAARIGMAAMLCFTAVGHFVYITGMSMMLPTFVPFRQPLVVLTGIFEIALAIGLLIPSQRNRVAWILIAFLILVLPANIYAAIKHVDYQEGSYGGNGLSYLWFRVPLQLCFICWTYFAAIKN